MQRLSHGVELLDGPLDDPRVVDHNLVDLSHVNRWLGGFALTRKALERLLATRQGDEHAAAELRILDVGTGGADIPVALLDWGRRRGVPITVDAIDERSEMIESARRLRGDRAGLHLGVGDARQLPYPDATFDVAHMSLVLHHLEPDEAERALAEMARVSRVGVIVNDLDRNPLAWLGAWLLGHVFTPRRFSRHDAPLSVRRAYRPAEVRAMAARVGLRQHVQATGFVGHRYALGFVKTSAVAPRHESLGMEQG
jgi:ubiquinone/menaquinone biosynthesis C-methylase UbiE